VLTERQIQIKYMEASTTVAVLRERLNYTENQTEKFKKIKPVKTKKQGLIV